MDLGSALLGLPSSEIGNIQNDVFEDIVGTVSKIKGWEAGQLGEWAKKAKAVSLIKQHLRKHAATLRGKPTSH